MEVREGLSHLELFDGLLARRTRTGNFDDVCSVRALEIRRVGRLTNLSISPRARELDLGPSTALQIVEMLPTTANECTVLGGWDVHSHDNTILQPGSNLLQLLHELCDELGLAAQADFVGRLALARAVRGYTPFNRQHTLT